MDRHAFEGIVLGVADRPCTKPGCGQPDRHPIHTEEPVSEKPNGVAPDTTEPEAPFGPGSVIAALEITFKADGSISVNGAGVKANQLWAASGTLAAMAKDQWDAIRESRAAASPKLHLPVGGRPI